LLPLVVAAIANVVRGGREAVGLAQCRMSVGEDARRTRDGRALAGKKRGSPERTLRRRSSLLIFQDALRPVGIGTCLLGGPMAATRGGVAGLRRASPSASLDKSARIFSCVCAAFRLAASQIGRDYTRNRPPVTAVLSGIAWQRR